MLGGRRPIEVALTELRPRRLENLLWWLFRCVAAQGRGRRKIEGSDGKRTQAWQA
jgi:hypothetical protein